MNGRNTGVKKMTIKQASVENRDQQTETSNSQHETCRKIGGGHVAKGRSAWTYFLFAICAAVARCGLSSGVLDMLNSNKSLSLLP